MERIEEAVLDKALAVSSPEDKVLVCNLLAEINDLTSTLSGSGDTQSKLAASLQRKLAKLELFANGWLSAKDLAAKYIQSLDEELAAMQTDRLRFIACSNALLYFQNCHPIKQVFLDAIQFQKLVDKGGSANQYVEILSNFRRNLELMFETTIELDPAEVLTVSTAMLENTISNFVQESNLFQAFSNLQTTICQLTGKTEPGIDDTILIYYQIAYVGLRNTDFVMKLLTTCEGLDARQQDRFLSITYLKTSLLTMMDHLYKPK